MLEELINAVEDSANNKAPGIDCLPSEVYTKCDQTHLPDLLEMLEEAFT